MQELNNGILCINLLLGVFVCYFIMHLQAVLEKLKLGHFLIG